MVQVALDGVVFLIDHWNVVRFPLPEGLAPPEWRKALPSPEQKSKHDEVATRWLTWHCTDFACANEMHWLVQDDASVIWRSRKAVPPGFEFVSTADADAAIILLSYRLMKRKIEELSSWAAYVPADTPFFSQEEFKDYGPNKAKAAEELWELCGKDIRRLTDAAPRTRKVVVITKDNNLRAACEMAGAVVKGGLVDDWYTALSRAWRERSKVPPGTIY